MARGWKCPRCSNQNGEGTMNCAKCGLIRGGVVVPGTYIEPQATAPTPPLPPVPQSASAPPDLGPSDWQPLGSPVPPPPASQRSSLPIWRRIPIRLALFGILILGGAVVGWINNASRSSTGDITKGGDLTAENLRVGDCWDVKEPTASTIGKVTARPCSEGHQYEVFFIESMPAGNYPGEAEFSSYVQRNCLPAFGTYVGKDYEDSTLDIFWLYPSSNGWTGGDRSIECSAYDPGNDQLTASVKGSGQ